MELVTEPDVKSAEEAVAFAKELHLILRYLGVSDADMEKGQMRVEANISLDMGTKVEVKNLNSFKAVYGAIQYEIARQGKLLDARKEVKQETRGWSDEKQVTESQRSKESAHDYRYFPEPDLPPLDLRVFNIEALRDELPELPAAKRSRFGEEFGLNRDQVERLVEEKALADYFEDAASELKERLQKGDYGLLANYFLSDLRGLLNERGLSVGASKVGPEEFAHLVALVQEGKLSSRLAKDLLLKMVETGEDPEVLIQTGGVKVMSDTGELGKFVEEVIAANPKVVEDYKKGKGNALQFLIGQGMAKTKGQADPAVLKELFTKKLG